MSKDSSSSPSGKEFDGGRGGGSTGSGAASTKELTAEELRKQRLARFEGENKNPGQKLKPQLKDPPPASTTAAGTTTMETSTENLLVASAPHNTISGNITSNPIDTKPVTTTEKAVSFLPSLPTIEDDISDISRDIGNINGINAFLTDAELAEKEEEDLQAALALSMGLPIPVSVPKAIGAAETSNIEPLSAFETGSGRDEATSSISGDMLATAAMVAATSPSLGYAQADVAPAMPMRTQDEPDTDVDMEGDDRKPAAVVRTPKAPLSPSRILRSNPEHFSGRVRTWYESVSSYNVLDFHDCMWDKNVTTENDQVRWMAQGIQFKDEYDESRGQTTKTQLDAATPAENRTNNPSLLESIISGPGGEW